MFKIFKRLGLLPHILLLITALVPWYCQAIESRFIRDEAFVVELRPLSLVAVEAFLLSRGFPPVRAAKIARHACVHKLAVSNTGKGAASSVSIDLGEWQLHGLTGPWRPLILREGWSQRLQNSPVSQMGKMALNWALFPSQQTFHPGDRLWGWVTMGLPPATSFELQVVWRAGERVIRKNFAGLRCAPKDFQAQEEVKP